MVFYDKWLDSVYDSDDIDRSETPYPICNLTQHPATVEQRAAGVFDVPEWKRPRLFQLLTFETCPLMDEVVARAEAIAKEFETSEGWYLIGGAPYLMRPLERAIHARRGRCFYSFSNRVITETPIPDGTVVKTSVFKHGGFIIVGDWWVKL